MVNIVLNVAFCLGNTSTTKFLVVWNSEIISVKMLSVLVSNNQDHHQIYFMPGFQCNLKVYKYFSFFFKVSCFGIHTIQYICYSYRAARTTVSSRETKKGSTPKGNKLVAVP